MEMPFIEQPLVHGAKIPDRVLATVLFTDVVGSTARAAELGDAAWHEVLTRHHATVRGELSRHRGTEHDTAGDGFFASFDGPARAIRCNRGVAELKGVPGDWRLYAVADGA